VTDLVPLFGIVGGFMLFSVFFPHFQLPMLMAGISMVVFFLP
jgi:hypothetical protein